MSMTIPTSTYTVATLARAILELDILPPLEAAGRARMLVDEAKAVLATAGDAAITAAAVNATYGEVAAALGVSPSAVNKAVSRHRLRQRQSMTPSP